MEKENLILEKIESILQAKESNVFMNNNRIEISFNDFHIYVVGDRILFYDRDILKSAIKIDNHEIVFDIEEKCSLKAKHNAIDFLNESQKTLD